MSVGIAAEGLSKCYRIGLRDEAPDTFTGAMAKLLRSPLRNYRKYRSLYTFHHQVEGDAEGVLWALRDVSFRVEQGDVVGIIGRNGAGKSTLLKVLSRITEPTSGRALLRGRVASLLEVGTGFHPELTGRENVYLNGTILGMRKHEVDSKFDEIVDFSGVERFIDTPVKRYSSGMHVRLAFAVAAHLDPEILVIDEVLSVGDTSFQKKCMGKLERVAGEGRTVLFVSHNMGAVQSLCTRGILLEDGGLSFDGSPAEAVQRYATSVQQLVERQPLDARLDRHGGTEFRFTGVEFLDAATGVPLESLVSGQRFRIRATYRYTTGRPLEHVEVTISFWRMSGGFLFACSSDAVGKAFRVEHGNGEFVCEVPRCPLNGGRYHFNLFAKTQGATLDYVREAGTVDVEAGDFYGTGRLPAPLEQGVFVDYDWRQLLTAGAVSNGGNGARW